ncbi:MAG: response regulator transcription factor [Alphaproteobacteria bacterium]|nr:response regulator transcription factor [Alphaproteobacteria bacterium]
MMKLLLADGQPLFRDALANYIAHAEASSVIEHAGTGDALFKALAKNPAFDLLLVDVGLDGFSPERDISSLKRDYPDIRMALLAGEERLPQARTMNGKKNTVSVLPKTLSGKAFMKEIRHMLASRPKPGAYAENALPVLQKEQPAVEQRSPTSLTRREKDVVPYLVEGASNKEIARALDLQVVTVKIHVRSICNKLAAKNRTQAALALQKMRIEGRAL